MMDVVDVLVSVVLLWCAVQAVPRDRVQQMGPCIGMDCLHGVLMHGDGEMGDGHADEDAYNKLQAMDDQTRMQKSKTGPCQGEDCLHDLMHDPSENKGGSVKHMEQGYVGPEMKPQDGPCEGMNCLHGVLMHGDEQTGRGHEFEDENLRKVEENKEQDGPCIDCAEGRPHKHLPLDTTVPSSDETEHRDPPGAENPDHFLHGSATDVHDRKDNEQKEELKFVGTGVEHPDTLMHEEGFAHDEVGEAAQDAARPQFGTHDPETLLHGGHSGVHDQHPKNILNKVVSGTFDPHALLHGGDSHAHDDTRQQEKERKRKLEEHEHKDYVRWKEERAEEADPADVRGFSLPYISDTVIDEVTQMKAKYLADLIAAEEDDPEAIDDSDEEDEEDYEDEDEVEEELLDELAEEYEALLEADIEVVDDTEECKDCQSERAHVHEREAQLRADRLAGLIVDLSDSQDEIEQDAHKQSAHQKKVDDIEQNSDDPISIPRVVKIDDNHEHPSPYSSNYRTDRDNTL